MLIQFRNSFFDPSVAYIGVSEILKRLRQKLRRSPLLFWQRVRILAFRLVSTNRVEGEISIRQPLHCLGLGTISCGKGVVIGCYPSSYFLSTNSYLEARYPFAEIKIGSGTLINNNFVVIAERSSIRISEHCLMGFNVEITDSDFHALDFDGRSSGVLPRSESVDIDDHVFIGSNARIARGLSIGPNSVVANSSLVTRYIPAGAVAGGVPAKILGDVKTKKTRFERHKW